MKQSPAPFLLRPAVDADVATIHAMIRELAEFERLLHEVQSTEEDLRRALFGACPAAEAIVVEVDGTPAGFAIFFGHYSTFTGRTGLYLEDLYVRPQYRGSGLGKALLTGVGRLAFERGAARYEWSVLDWNENAIRFYKGCGAELHGDWRRMRVSGEALKKLAESDGATLS
ncbi:MAG TPA: GNAT family N-acetyltransferase [Roseimicrobium sp.]|nr:GNAT family N-acetyltransferase [Roseimicrobium sp.]